MDEYEAKQLKRGALLSLPFVTLWLAMAGVAYHYPLYARLAWGTAVGCSLGVILGCMFSRRFEGVRIRDLLPMYAVLAVFGLVFLWGIWDGIREHDPEGIALMLLICLPMFISYAVAIITDRRRKH